MSSYPSEFDEEWLYQVRPCDIEINRVRITDLIKGIHSRASCSPLDFVTICLWGTADELADVCPSPDDLRMIVRLLYWNYETNAPNITLESLIASGVWE